MKQKTILSIGIILFIIINLYLLLNNNRLEKIVDKQELEIRNNQEYVYKTEHLKQIRKKESEIRGKKINTDSLVAIFDEYNTDVINVLYICVNFCEPCIIDELIKSEKILNINKPLRIIFDGYRDADISRIIPSQMLQTEKRIILDNNFIITEFGITKPTYLKILKDGLIIDALIPEVLLKNQLLDFLKE